MKPAPILATPARAEHEFLIQVDGDPPTTQQRRSGNDERTNPANATTQVAASAVGLTRLPLGEESPVGSEAQQAVERSASVRSLPALVGSKKKRGIILGGERLNSNENTPKKSVAFDPGSVRRKHMFATAETDSTTLRRAVLQQRPTPVTMKTRFEIERSKVDEAEEVPPPLVNKVDCFRPHRDQNLHPPYNLAWLLRFLGPLINKRFAATLLYLACCVYFNCVLQVFVDYTYVYGPAAILLPPGAVQPQPIPFAKRVNRQILTDWGFMLFPRLYHEVPKREVIQRHVDRDIAQLKKQFPNQDTRLMDELQKIQRHVGHGSQYGTQRHNRKTVYVEKFGNEKFLQATEALVAGSKGAGYSVCSSAESRKRVVEQLQSATGYVTLWDSQNPLQMHALDGASFVSENCDQSTASEKESVNAFVLAEVDTISFDNRATLEFGEQSTTDAAHALVPKNESNSEPLVRVDLFVNLTLFLLIVPILILHKRRDLVSSRICFIYGTLWLLRGISIAVTPLPPPDPLCDPGIMNPNESFLVQGLRVMFGQRSTCCDCLFSGHTMALTLAWLHTATYAGKDIGVYGRNAELAIRSFSFVLMVAGFFIIISTHFHYTVDVYLGFVITVLLWRVYFMTANAATNMMNPTTPWCYVIRWIEGFEVPKIVVSARNGKKMMIVEMPELQDHATKGKAQQALLEDYDGDFLLGPQQRRDGGEEEVANGRAIVVAAVRGRPAALSETA